MFLANKDGFFVRLGQIGWDPGLDLYENSSQFTAALQYAWDVVAKPINKRSSNAQPRFWKWITVAKLILSSRLTSTPLSFSMPVDGNWIFSIASFFLSVFS
jgi:hypothetical protein